MADNETEVFTTPGEPVSEHEAAQNILGLMGSFDEEPETEETPDASNADAPAEEQVETEADEVDEETETEEEVTDEEEEQGEEETEAPAAQTFKVKVDGKEVEVTLDELQKSYSFTGHLTRKSQALAEERKAFEAEKQAVSGERARFAELLGQMEVALQSLAGEEPDWDKLKVENPIEYVVKRTEWQENQQRLAGVQLARQQAEMQLAQEREAKMQEHLVAEQQKLLEAIPAWKDKKVAREQFAQLADYATEQYGYTAEDLQRVSDHRLFVILNKAKAFDALQASKPKIQQQARQIVKTAKPGAGSLGNGAVSGTTRAKQRATRTGSVEDAADVILKLGLV